MGYWININMPLHLLLKLIQGAPFNFLGKYKSEDICKSVVYSNFTFLYSYYALVTYTRWLNVKNRMDITR